MDGSNFPVSSYRLSMTLHQSSPINLKDTDKLISIYRSRYDSKYNIYYDSFEGLSTDEKSLNILYSTVTDIYVEVKKFQKELNALFEYIEGSGSNQKSNTPLSNFLLENRSLLNNPRAFFQKFFAFFNNYVTGKLCDFKKAYGQVPDGIFERIVHIREFIILLEYFDKHPDPLDMKKTIGFVNELIISSSKSLLDFLSDIYGNYPFQVMITKSFIIFKARVEIGLQNILKGLYNIRAEIRNLNPRIKQNSLCDITSPENKEAEKAGLSFENLQLLIKSYNLSSVYQETPPDLLNIGTAYKLRFLRNVMGGAIYLYETLSRKYIVKKLTADPFNVDNNDIVLNHMVSPYVVQIYKVFYSLVILDNNEEISSIWVVLEFLDAKVSDIINKRKTASKKSKIIRKFIKDVLNGIIYLRSNGISHADLHYDNVMAKAIKNEGRIDYQFKIIDFSRSTITSDAIERLRSSTKYKPKAVKNTVSINDFESLFLYLHLLYNTYEEEDLIFKNFISVGREMLINGNLNLDTLLNHEFLIKSD